LINLFSKGFNIIGKSSAKLMKTIRNLKETLEKRSLILPLLCPQKVKRQSPFLKSASPKEKIRKRIPLWRKRSSPEGEKILLEKQKRQQNYQSLSRRKHHQTLTLHPRASPRQMTMMMTTTKRMMTKRMRTMMNTGNLGGGKLEKWKSSNH